MKRTILILGFIICLVSICRAADSPIALYSKWQNISATRLMKMGRDFDIRSSCDSALVCYSVVADRLRNTASNTEEKKMLARALNNMGFIYSTYYFDYQKGIDLFQESLKVSQECGYAKNIPYVNLNIGGVYLGCNMIYGTPLFSDEVWNYLDRALESALETKQYEVAVVAFINMGQMYFANQRNDRLQQAIKKLEAAGMPGNMALVAFGRQYANGLFAYMKKDYATAVASFRAMLPLVPKQDINASRYELVVLMALTYTYAESGDYQLAITTGNELINKARSCGSSDTETSAYRLLSLIYDKSNQKDKAAEYMLQFHHKKDSTLSERDITMLSKMPLVNELEDMKRQLEEEYAKRRMMIIVAVVAAIFLLLLALYLTTVIRSRRKLRTYVNELYRKNVELIQSEQRARELREERADTSEEKYSSSNLTAPESKRIAERILQIMDDTELITNPDFSLKDMAERAGYSQKIISQVVNETLGKNFRTLLNEYRIKEACARLIDTDTYGQYTIEHISESVGFNSRSNFSVMFKKITGLTPAQFQKNAVSNKD